MLCEAHRDARVQRYRVELPCDAWPHTQKADEVIAWVEARVAEHANEHPAPVVVRTLMDLYCEIDSERLVRDRYPLHLFALGHDLSKLVVALPIRLREKARAARIASTPPRESEPRRTRPAAPAPRIAPAHVRGVLDAVVAAGGAR